MAPCDWVQCVLCCGCYHTLDRLTLQPCASAEWHAGPKGKNRLEPQISDVRWRMQRTIYAFVEFILISAVWNALWIASCLCL